MAIRNITPRFSIIGMTVGICALIVGGWLIYSDFETLLRFLKLFIGFFLLLFGLGLVGASISRR